MTIGFFGLSHLGLNYLAASAAKGFRVVGYDKNKELIEKLKSNKVILKEPLLFENLKRFNKNILFSNKISDLKKSKIIFISLDVKTDKYGKSDLIEIKKIIKIIKLKINKKNLILMSQVKPGFTKKISWDKSRLFYQVETLVFGQAFQRALNPERIILGVNNPQKNINNQVKNFYNKFNCPIIKTDYNTAELIKIAVNIYLISSITTTNLLAKIVKKLNGNWEDLEKAIRLDKRIGKFAYLNPGLGISGGNLERDLYNISQIAKQNNISHDLFKIWKKNSVKQKSWASSFYNNEFKKNKNLRIGILGLAYKINTNSTKNSPSLDLIKNIKENKIYAFDPVVKKIKKQKNLTLTQNSNDIINISDVLFVMTPWYAFKNIKIQSIIKSKIKKIIDPFGIFKNENELLKRKKIKYYSLI